MATVTPVSGKGGINPLSYDPLGRELEKLPIIFEVKQRQFRFDTNVRAIPTLDDVIIEHSDSDDFTVLEVGDEFAGELIADLYMADRDTLVINRAGSEPITIKKGAMLMVDGDHFNVSEITPLEKAYGDEALKAIINMEIENSRQINFKETIARWNMDDDSIALFGELLFHLYEGGILKRNIVISKIRTKRFLRDAFIQNCLDFFQPLIYHQFQIDELKRYLNDIGIQRGLAGELAGLLEESKFFNLVDFQIFLDEKGLPRNKKNEVYLGVKKIVSGATEVKPKVWHPHWFDDEFASRWKKRLPRFAGMIIREHFPVVYDRKNNGFVRYLLDKRLLEEELGDAFSALEFAFTLPRLNFLVRSDQMRWDHINPKEFYDGVSMAEEVGRSSPTAFQSVNIHEVEMAYSIVIHPLQLLLEDVYGWKHLLWQTMHHELCHVLQFQYVKAKMAGLYLKYGKHPRTSGKFAFLERIRGKIDVGKTLDLISEANKRLYIRETIPAGQEMKYTTLEEYINKLGGHTTGFIDLVQRFKYCELAWMERDEYMRLVENFAYRIVGGNFSKGLMFNCKKDQGS